MKDRLIKWAVVIGASVAVIFPLWVHIRSALSADAPILVSIFPLFGLLAASLLWLHAISGVFEGWLRERFDFDAFVHWTAILIFASIVLHPLLVLILVKFNLAMLFSSNIKAITLGIVGFFLLLTYDIGKVFKRYGFFSRHWNAILVISTIGFLLTFLHSLSLGSDLQSGFMRKLWIFYGVTAVLATIYTYGVKKFLRNS